MRSATCLSSVPSLPPGCSRPKSTAVKPWLSRSAIASASPSASCISAEVVGARLCGQASRACGRASTTSAFLARVELRARGHGDQADVVALRIVGDVFQLRGLARPRQRENNVALGDHAEIAVARLGRVHEQRRRAGRGKGRGDLVTDMAGLAHAGNDDAALRVADQFDRLRKERRQGRREARRRVRRRLRLRLRACAARNRSLLARVRRFGRSTSVSPSALIVPVPRHCDSTECAARQGSDWLTPLAARAFGSGISRRRPRSPPP